LCLVYAVIVRVTGVGFYALTGNKGSPLPVQ